MSPISLSTAWKPEDGRTYGIVDLVMAPDFKRADAAMWGLVEVKNLQRATTIEVLRVQGDPEWHPRFDWLNWDKATNTVSEHPWQEALGGVNGAHTALCGVHVLDCAAQLRVKRLEVSGVPGPGIMHRNSRIQIDSARFHRTGWPVYGDYENPRGGSVLKGITSTGGHWWGRAWGSPGFGDPRAQTLRRLDTKVLMRGELVVNEAGYRLDDYVHHGDGISMKIAGTEYLVRRFQGGAGWFSGSVPANLTQFPDPVRYRHLHESKNCRVEDSEQVGNTASATIQSRALNYVSYPFTTPLVFRRCVFVKGPHLFAFQINYATVVFEDCDFVGWADAPAALELSPSYQGMPPGVATTTGSRFWAT